MEHTDHTAPQSIEVLWQEDTRILTLEGEPVLEYHVSWPCLLYTSIPTVSGGRNIAAAAASVLILWTYFGWMVRRGSGCEEKNCTGNGPIPGRN